MLAGEAAALFARCALWLLQPVLVLALPQRRALARLLGARPGERMVRARLILCFRMLILSLLAACLCKSIVFMSVSLHPQLRANALSPATCVFCLPFPLRGCAFCTTPQERLLWRLNALQGRLEQLEYSCRAALTMPVLAFTRFRKSGLSVAIVDAYRLPQLVRGWEMGLLRFVRARAAGAR